MVKKIINFIYYFLGFWNEAIAAIQTIWTHFNAIISKSQYIILIKRYTNMISGTIESSMTNDF